MLLSARLWTQESSKKTMSNNISFYQIKQGLTDRQVAEKANLSESYYNKVKNGRICPTVHTALRVARAVGRSVETLWGERK
jgi:transcriptional regulator with XRE-family HTH domain